MQGPEFKPQYQEREIEGKRKKLREKEAETT
jgi:hypothetical protein